MPVNAENTADALEARDWERTGETISGTSADLIEERIKANLEPLNPQISTLTQLLSQLIQDNSARNSPMAPTLEIVDKLNLKKKFTITPCKY